MDRRRTLVALALLLAPALGSLWLGRTTTPPPVATPARLAPPPPPAAAVGPLPAPPPGLPIRILAPATPPDDRPATFEGRVVSAASGRPIDGADLTFSRAGAAASTRTGPDGAFLFAPPTVGRWLLAAVTAKGYFPFAPEWGHSPVQLDARAGQHVRGLEIQLAPAVELHGLVVDPDDHPVAGATVRLLGVADEASLVTVPDRFTSGPDGAFTFAAPEGAVLEASHPGFLPGRAEVGPLQRANRRVVVELGPRHEPLPAAAPITGTVAQAGGGPVEGALVLASREAFGDAGGRSAQAVTTADGTFALRELSPGRYRVTARAEGLAPAEARRVSPGQAIRLELSPGGRLRGCVRDASSGAPVAPFTVMVFERRGALRRVPQRSLSVVDPAGCYALDDLTPGPVAVVFSAPRYAPSEESRVDIPAPGAEAVVDGLLSAGGQLTGRVVDQATRAPLPGTLLSVEGTLTSAASTFPVLATAEADADGRFALGGLPRRFSLEAAAAGHHARILGGLETTPGGSSGPIEIALRAVAPGDEPRVELAGVGLQLTADGETLAVTGLIAGGGAAEVGLLRGDHILAVDGRPVESLGLGGAIDAIRGPEGTTVRLTVRRGEATREVDVPRRLVRG